MSIETRFGYVTHSHPEINQISVGDIYFISSIGECVKVISVNYEDGKMYVDSVDSNKDGIAFPRQLRIIATEPNYNII